MDVNEVIKNGKKTVYFAQLNLIEEIMTDQKSTNPLATYVKNTPGTVIEVIQCGMGIEVIKVA